MSWLGKHVEALVNISCEQAQQRIIDRGDKLNWTAAFDGFYLTRGYHSNNCSATLHDHSTNKICWFAHRTKKGPGANWQGTSGGAEGDMLRTILEEMKGKGFEVTQIIMDHDTSGGNIACSIFSRGKNHLLWQSHCQKFSPRSDENKISSLQGKTKLK